MSRPHLSTQRIRLEPLTTAHTELLVELDSDPEVMRFLTGRASSREEVVATGLPRRTRADADARSLGYWVGFDDDVFLGWWSLAIDDTDPTAAELGYRLRRTAWGQGYAAEGRPHCSATPSGRSDCDESGPRRWRSTPHHGGCWRSAGCATSRRTSATGPIRYPGGVPGRFSTRC